MREGFTIGPQASCTGRPHRLPSPSARPRQSEGLKSRRPRSLVVTASFRPVPSEPAYNKYRSRSDIQKSYIKEWLQTTATEDIVAEERRTFTSTLQFLPNCLKYYVVPLFLRYIWYVIWRALRARCLYPFQKRFVRWDCKLDAALAKLGNRGEEVGFSRGMALARFHFRIGVIGDLRYRWILLRTGDLGSWKQFYKVPVSKFYLEEGFEEPEPKEEVEVAYYVDKENLEGPLEPKAI